MNFGKALESLKEGKKVARKGWNGENQWVKKIDSRCWKIEPSIIGDYAESDILILKNAQDKVFAWIPSLGDIFAEDWVFVE